MQFVTGFHLIGKTDSELSALFHTFNQAVARTKPFTREWSDAVFSVNNILGERISLGGCFAAAAIDVVLNLQPLQRAAGSVGPLRAGMAEDDCTVAL